SHKYVAERAAVMLNKPLDQLRLITCHLGNGVSITAVDKGKSLDTSMGFTPLAGVTMGTRSGDVDPAIIPYIMEKTGMSAPEVINVFIMTSGLVALFGILNDMRDILAAVEPNDRAQFVLVIFEHRIHRYMVSFVGRM